MNQSQVFSSSGTFNVPANVSLVLVTMIGGGGGGNGWPGNAGGAGEICIRMPIKVTPSGTLAITVGAKGSGAKSGAYTNTDGGDSIVGPIRTNGGHASYPNGGNPAFPIGGPGGGVTGAEGRVANIDGMLAPRTAIEPDLPIDGGRISSHWWGGGSGGGAGGAGSPDGNLGAAAVNNHLGGDRGGTQSGTSSGSGGASSPWGRGGKGGAGTTNDNATDVTPSHYGAGGGGGSNAGTGADGAGGYVLIEWCET